MADNVGITPGTGATAAADEIDGVLHQRVKITIGSDGVSRGDVDVTNPMPVRQDDLGSIEQAAEQLNTALVDTGNDEPLQLVRLHPNFPLPIDTATPMPVAGLGPSGEQRRIRTDDSGAVVTAGTFQEKQFPAAFFTNNGRLPERVWDCQGYTSAQITVEKSGGDGISIEFSQDVSRNIWVAATFLTQFGGAGSATSIWQPSISTAGVYNLSVPIYARYMRFRTTVSNAENIRINVTLRQAGYVAPLNTPVNITQVGSGAVTTASAVLGVSAFGPTAPGSAHSTNSPIQISGSDGTNVRRILTDTAGNTAVVGHVAPGATLIPATANRGPVLVGAADLEQRAQRMVVDGIGRLRIQNEQSSTAHDGVIDALNNVVRELKLLNAKLTDLPYYLGINAVMPDDDMAFRDDPTIFNQ
jgi:hypothetical protein